MAHRVVSLDRRVRGAGTGLELTESSPAPAGVTSDRGGRLPGCDGSGKEQGCVSLTLAGMCRAPRLLSAGFSVTAGWKVGRGLGDGSDRRQIKTIVKKKVKF